MSFIVGCAFRAREYLLIVLQETCVHELVVETQRSLAALASFTKKGLGRLLHTICNATEAHCICKRPGLPHREPHFVIVSISVLKCVTGQT